jgi:hypothetical protein
MIDKDTTLEDIVKNPAKYGAPTFQQWRQNKDKWRVDWAAIADNGSRQLAHQQVRQLYKVGKYIVKSIEEAERIARDMGFTLSRMPIAPQIRPQGGQKHDIIVEFKLPRTG